MYSIEIAEGRQWQNGISSRYVTDIYVSDEGFKPVCRGIDTYAAEISDLKANTCYHVRLHIEYHGNRVWSNSIPVPTLQGVPAIPSRPRVEITNRKCSYDPAGKEPRLYVTWTPPNENGSPITKYQVQVREVLSVNKSQQNEPQHFLSIAGGSQSGIFESVDDINDDMLASSIAGEYDISAPPPGRVEPEELDEIDKQILSHVSRPKHHDHRTEFFNVHTMQAIVPKMQSGKETEVKAWETVYSNLRNEAIVMGPSPLALEFHIRVRAQNAVGWSDFGLELKLHARTHPSLFPVAFKPRLGAGGISSDGEQGGVARTSSNKLRAPISISKQRERRGNPGGYSPGFSFLGERLPSLDTGLKRPGSARLKSAAP